MNTKPTIPEEKKRYKVVFYTDTLTIIDKILSPKNSDFKGMIEDIKIYEESLEK